MLAKGLGWGCQWHPKSHPPPKKKAIPPLSIPARTLVPELSITAWERPFPRRPPEPFPLI